MMPYSAGAMKFPDDSMDPDAEAAPPVEVPWTALSAEALRGVIESFVLREGTDYGAREHTHEEKVQQVQTGLERGEVRIMFDPQTESVTLLPSDRR